MIHTTKAVTGPWANRIWGPFITYMFAPCVYIKFVLDDGGPSSLGASGLQSILVHTYIRPCTWHISFMVIWCWTCGKGPLREWEETHCCLYMGYYFSLAARVVLYELSHIEESIYHSLCYTSRGALAGMRNISMVPPWRIDLMTHCTMSWHCTRGGSGT